MAVLLYLLKVGISLVILYGFYRLVLADRPLGGIKRAYLLLSLVAAHAFPLLPVREVSVPARVVEEVTSSPVVLPGPAVDSVPAGASAPDYTATGLLLVYWSGVLISGGLFVRSIGLLLLRVRRGQRRRYGPARLVELPGSCGPHSFLHWIFYGCDRPPSALILAHEYAHVVQWHSLDRLFIGLLRVVAWFNPLLILFERAIVQNHEMLADRAVLRAGYSLRQYQYGLLAELRHRSGRVALASGADFSFTKKRMLIMHKPTTSTRTVLVSCLLACGLGVTLLYSFGRTQTVALPPSPAPQATASAVTDGNDSIPPPPPVLEIRERKPRIPTVDQMRVWQDAAAYGVWIDGRRVKNADLGNYQTDDFHWYSVSRLMPNAKDYGRYEYQLDLTTRAVFQRNRYVPNWQSSSCRWEPKPVKEDC